jgi:hypothetical protein
MTVDEMSLCRASVGRSLTERKNIEGKMSKKSIE